MGLFDVFSSDDAQQAAQDQINGINTGLTQATGAINTGNDALTSNYTSALQPFLQNQTTANAGTTALGNALGLNGASGNAAATSAFQNNPGYQFALNQGTQNVDRNQAATGQLDSGNTDTAVANYTTGLANQGWNQYISSLMPYLGASQTAASGIAGVDTGLGTALNNNQGSLANLDWTAATGTGNANANAELAKYGASSNMLGALTGGLGMLSGSSGLLSGLSSFFPSGSAGGAGGSI